jgi:hypothetical protein
MAYINCEATKAFMKEYLEDLISVIRSDSPIAEGYKLCIEHAINGFKFVPTADVEEVRHGEMRCDGHHLHFNCCNKVLAIIVNESDDYDDFISCPFCGAKLDRNGGAENS